MDSPDLHTHILVFSPSTLTQELERLTAPRYPTRKLIAISLLDVVCALGLMHRYRVKVRQQYRPQLAAQVCITSAMLVNSPVFQRPPAQTQLWPLIPMLAIRMMEIGCFLLGHVTVMASTHPARPNDNLRTLD